MDVKNDQTYVKTDQEIPCDGVCCAFAVLMLAILCGMVIIVMAFIEVM